MPFAAARLFVFGHVADVANVAVVADVAPPCGCLFRAFPMLKSLTPILCVSVDGGGSIFRRISHREHGKVKILRWHKF